MAETYDFGQPPSELDQHMEKVHKYLQQVKQGRSIRSVDPNQPALSHDAETLRQATAVDKANRNTPQNEQNSPESYDFSQGDTTPEVHDFGSTEGNLERSTGSRPFHPGQLLDFVMQPMDPSLRADLEKVTGKSTLDFTDPKTWTPGNIGKSLVGTVADALTTPMTYLGNPVTGTAKGLIPKTVVKPVVPLSQSDLDMQVAQRAVTKPAFETGAYPDAELVPQVRQGTGRTLITPDYTVGKTAETYGAPENSLRPSEVQSGQQTTLLGGHNVLGNTSALTGKYALEPSEQLPLSALSLREQQLTKGAQTAKGQQDYSDFITKALKSRLLTPKMMDDLVTSPAERGGSPVTIQMSKGGSASAGYAEDTRYTLPKEFTVDNTLDGAIDGAIFPNAYTRSFAAITDTLRKISPAQAQGADLIDKAYTNRAMASSQDMLNVTKDLDTILGRSTLRQRIGMTIKQLTEGENGFIAGIRKLWNIPENTQEQIFNYMITNGRMLPKDPKAKAAADALYQKGLYPASSDPGVRSLPGVFNQFTKKYTPFGEPNMFHPQQPVHGAVKNAISDAHWNIAYQQAGGESLGIPMHVYRDTVLAYASHDPEITAAKMLGLENMKLLDIGRLGEATGQSPYQIAKKLGYETDPFRATFRFNSMARLRGQLAQIDEPLKQIRATLPATTKQDQKIVEWVNNAHDRALMNPGKWDATNNTKDTLKGISHVMDLSMLQMGGLANMAQSSYIAARGGARATIKGTFDMLTGRDREIIQQSGALFPAMMSELTNPSGPLATFSSMAYKLYGMNLVNRNTYVFAGHVGNAFIKQLETNLLAKPGNKRIQGLISELGGDPAAILREGSIPDQMRLAMIQRFANHTGGATDVRGIPLWASSENPWARLINKYRTFAASNSGEVRRLVMNAPTPAIAIERVAKLLAGAYVVGGGINEMRKGLRDMLMGEEARPSKQGLAKHAERIVQGLGTMEGMFIVNAANDPISAVLAAVGGPAAGVTASFIQDLQSTAQHGIGWRTIDTVSKRVPIVGPIVGPLTSKQVRRESKQTAENSRLLHE